MTLAGLEHSGPAPAGSRTRLCARCGARGRAPRAPPSHPLPCSTALPPAGAHGVGAHAGRRPRLAQGSWPTTNEKGNGPARPGQGPLLAPTCGRRPALTPGGRGASPSDPPPRGCASLLRASARARPFRHRTEPPQRDLPSATPSSDRQIHAARAARTQGRGSLHRRQDTLAGAGEGGVRRKLSNRPKASKTKLKTSGAVPTFSHLNLRRRGRRGGEGHSMQMSNSHLARSLLPAWTSGPPRPAAGQETSHQD